jgi:hypothetical protein
MYSGNLIVISMVLAVVICVLSIGYAVIYRLDRAVDPRDR